MDSAPVTAVPNPADANRTTLDASEASATSELYRAAIGAIHTDQYLRIFERFDAADRSSPHWNWAAAFMTLNWMALRGLWGAALTYLGTVSASVLLLLGIGRLVYSLSNEALWATSALLLLLTIAVPGLWGNALFYAASRKRMAAALAANHTVPQACAMLLRGASSRKRLLWVALANAALGAAVLGFVLNMPTVHRPPAMAGEASVNTASSRPREPVLAPPAAAPEAASSAMVAASSPVPVASAVANAPAAAPIALAASEPANTAASLPAASAPVTVVAPPEQKAEAAVPAPTPAPVSAPAGKKPAEKPAAKVKAPPAATATKPALPSPPSGPKFFANAGLFANETNAKNAHAKLLDAGIAAFTQEVTGPRGTFTRVRVGPFKTREEAVAAVMKIRGLGLDAEIVNPP